jgi:hypothetical protein
VTTSTRCAHHGGTVRRRLRPLVLLVFPAIATAPVTAAPTTPASSGAAVEIAVRAQYDEKDSRTIRMELENRSARTVRIAKPFLPWGSTFAALFAAVPMTDPVTSARCIERTTIMENPVGPEIAIEPGQTLRGTVELQSQFPELEKHLRRGDVIVFWSYVPRLSDGTEGKRQSGTIVVNRLSTSTQAAEDP